MGACKSNEECFDLGLSQLKVQWNTVGLETLVVTTPAFASCQQWMSLALECPFSRTVLYPSKRKP